VGVAAGIVGVGSLAGAAILWFSSNGETKYAKNVRFAPVASQRQVGLAMGVTW
jgi:hypothetical protein